MAETLKAGTPSENGSSSTSQAGDEGSSSSSAATQVYEGVSADDFADYAKNVEAHLDMLSASAVIVVFTICICAGILAVETLIKSFEW